MLSYLVSLDLWLLLLINGLHNHFMDMIMIYLSSKLGWLPLYLILLYLVVKYEKRNWWLVLISVAITITISDQSSVHLFKNVFERLRPCYVEDLTDKLHLITGCGGSYGFVSSHAANSAALSTFMILLLRKQVKWVLIVMMIYTILVSYSRIYLAKHYPSDVIAGVLLGILVGYITFNLYYMIRSRR